MYFHKITSVERNESMIILIFIITLIFNIVMVKFKQLNLLFLLFWKIREKVCTFLNNVQRV